MSYSNSPARLSFAELSRKNQMIQKLKQEINEQRQKEDEYNELLSEVKALEVRIDTLSLEKEKTEFEQKSKHSGSLKTILELKTELDSIQAILREKKIEFQEIESEFLSLRQMNDIKNNEIGRLKMELKNFREKNAKLKENKEIFKGSAQRSLGEKNENEQTMANLLKEIENLRAKNYDDERKLQEFEFEIQRNETLNFQGQKSNKSQEAELNAKIGQIENQEKTIQRMNVQNEKIQKEIAKLENKNEDIKQKIIQSTQTIQREKGKEIDFETQAINFDKVIKKKQQELEFQDKRFAETQENYFQNKEINEGILKDYNLLVNHLNLLVTEKENILSLLSRSITEDESISKYMDGNFTQMNGN